MPRNIGASQDQASRCRHAQPARNQGDPDPVGCPEQYARQGACEHQAVIFAFRAPPAWVRSVQAGETMCVYSPITMQHRRRPVPPAESNPGCPPAAMVLSSSGRIRSLP